MTTDSPTGAPESADVELIPRQSKSTASDDGEAFKACQKGSCLSDSNCHDVAFVPRPMSVSKDAPSLAASSLPRGRCRDRVRKVSGLRATELAQPPCRQSMTRSRETVTRDSMAANSRDSLNVFDRFACQKADHSMIRFWVNANRARPLASGSDQPGKIGKPAGRLFVSR